MPNQEAAPDRRGMTVFHGSTAFLPCQQVSLPFGGLEQQMLDLKARAKSFLERPYPLGPYAEGNLTDGFIHRYVQGGPWGDPELQDLLRLCLLTALTEAQSHDGEGQAYYQECAEVLQGIMAEVYGE